MVKERVQIIPIIAIMEKVVPLIEAFTKCISLTLCEEVHFKAINLPCPSHQTLIMHCVGKQQLSYHHHHRYYFLY